MKTFLGLLALTFFGCTDPALEERVAGLEEKVESLQKQGPAGRPAPANAEDEQAASGLLREASELAKNLKYDEAKGKVAELKKKYGSTRAARSAARLSSELDVIGREAGSLDVEKWFVGSTDFNSGEATLVVFWEIWCPHCRREVPNLQKTYNNFSGKGLNMLALTKVTKSASDEKVAEFIAENNLTYPSAKERGDEMSRRFNIRGIPAAVVLKNDKVVWRGHPAQLSDEMIENWL
jgi:thiol-disulfide isomerase/thioredoxin